MVTVHDLLFWAAHVNPHADDKFYITKNLTTFSVVAKQLNRLAQGRIKDFHILLLVHPVGNTIKSPKVFAFLMDLRNEAK